MSAATGKAIKAGVNRTAQKAAYSPLMEALARLGYGVRGLIYITMGILALAVVFGKTGTPSDQQGAIAAIGKQPAGMFFLWVVLVGLVSYALWGVIRAVLDPLNKGHDLKGLFARGGYLVSAVSYAILVLPTYNTITGAGRPAQNGVQGQLSLTSFMSTVLGRGAVGVAGLLVIAIGIYLIYQGFNNSFDKQFQTYAMNAEEKKLVTLLGRFGSATRGFIIALVGVLLFLAAYQFTPNKAVGINAALAALLGQPYGIYLLGIAAFGLIAFGIYSMLSAAWFRMRR